jgi:predicted SAM-dependent methyltransferase
MENRFANRVPGRLRHAWRILKLRRQARRLQPLNVVLGAGGTCFEGWLSTDADVLNLLSPRDWAKLFKPDSIDRLLMEHVLEHLSEGDGQTALALCRHYLKSSGWLRLAVPDGYRKDPDYAAEVAPPKDGHKMLFTVDSLVPLVESVGFRAQPLEYYDRAENFHALPWDGKDGHVQRSARFDNQTRFARDGRFYTSLIVDAVKD